MTDCNSDSAANPASLRRAVILSCQSLTEYVRRVQISCGTDFPIVELDRDKHQDPAVMREHILEKLRQLPDEVDTVLVAMGFCGGSWQGVSSSKTLVIPRTADCVALMLTTPDRYAPDLKEPGHMYVFGDGSTGFSVSGIYHDLREKYDEDTAQIIFNMYFEHYYHLDIIDNGLYDCYSPDYVEIKQKEADSIHAELDYVPGSGILLEKLVSGRWDDQFYVVEPGTVIIQGAFFDT